MAIQTINEGISGLQAAGIIVGNDNFNYGKLAASLARIGVNISDAGANALASLTGSNLEDPDVWGVGYLRSNGSIADDQTNWRHSLAYIPLSAGTYPDVLLRLSGNAHAVFYNADLEVVGFVANPNTGSTFNSPITAPEGTAFIRISQALATPDTTNIKIISQLTAIEITDKVFIKNELLQSIGASSSSGNLLEDLAASDLSDTELWGDGFLHKASGAPTVGTGWKYSLKYYEIPEALIHIFTRISGNAGIAIYDKDKNVLTSFGANTASSFNGAVTPPAGSKYIRVSFGAIYGSPSQIRVNSATPFYGTTSRVFVKTSELFDLMAPFLEKWGFKFLKAGENTLADLAASSLTDAEVWLPDSYLGSSGQPAIGAGAVGWYTTIQYYPAYAGKFFLTGRYRGNAKVVLYDKNNAPIEIITNPTNVDLNTQLLTFPVNTASIRLSFRGDQSQVPQIKLTPEEDMYVSSFSSGSAPAPSVDMREIYKAQYPAGKPHAVISFIADDCGHAMVTDGSGTYDWYLKALDDLGIKSTFALISGRLPSSVTAFWNVEDVISAFNNGMDIAGHTVDHDGNNRLNTLTREQLEYQIGHNRLDIKGLDDRLPVEMFISPFGARNNMTDEVVRYEGYLANFVSRADSEVAAGTCTNLPPIITFNLKRVSFDASNPDISRIDLVKQAVDVANTVGGWLVFAIHPHYAEYLQPNSVDRRAEFYELVEYIQSLNIPIMTARQGFDFYKNRVELNYPTISPNNYTLGMNGVEVNNFF